MSTLQNPTVFQTAESLAQRGARYEKRQGSLESSQERRFNLNLHSEHSAKKSYDKPSLVTHDYSMRVGSSVANQSFSFNRPRVGSRGLCGPLTIDS